MNVNFRKSLEFIGEYRITWQVSIFNKFWKTQFKLLDDSQNTNFREDILPTSI